MHTKRSSPPSKTPPRLFLAALSIAMLGACSTQQAPGESPSTGHSPAAQPAPVAYLQANTGGDSMGAPSKAAGHVLEMHVIDGGHDVEPVAQCRRISSGSALGGGTERELQVALCEGDTRNQGEYWLISEPGVVSVRRGPIDGKQQTILEHRLQNPQARAVAKEEQ